MRVWSQMIHVRPVAPNDEAVARFILRTQMRRWRLPALVASIAWCTWWLASDLASRGIPGRTGRWVSDGIILLILVTCLWMGALQVQLLRWAHRFAPKETTRLS
jgi:hypothetical protein